MRSSNKTWIRKEKEKIKRKSKGFAGDGVVTISECTSLFSRPCPRRHLYTFVNTIKVY